MAKIYLSATYSDLKEYRDAVYRILRKVRHDVISMEDYVATDQYPLHKCLQDVAGSDLYVGMIGWRYGYIPAKDNPEKRSITELEYRQAGDARIPRLLFLAEKDAPGPDAAKDTITGEGDGGQRIAALRAEIEQATLVSYFKNPDQLAGLVLAAVSRTPAGKPTAATKTPTVRQIKARALEHQLTDLIEEYETVSVSLATKLDPSDQLRLKRKLDNLEKEMEEVENELSATR